MTIKGEDPVHVMRGQLGLSTEKMDVGSYMVFTKVFLVLDKRDEKVLLTSHGPKEIFIMHRPSG